MEWLKEKLGFSISSTEAKTGEFTNQEIDPCSGCPQPCETHPTYPVYLAKKINQSKPLHGTGIIEIISNGFFFINLF